MTTNWGQLYEQNRCKALGIPWSEAEAHALYQLKIPAEFVRQGCLSVEEWKAKEVQNDETEKRTGKVQLLTLKKEKLAALCEKHGIAVTPDAPRPALIEALMMAGVPKSVPTEEVQ